MYFIFPLITASGMYSGPIHNKFLEFSSYNIPSSYKTCRIYSLYSKHDSEIYNYTDALISLIFSRKKSKSILALPYICKTGILLSILQLCPN
mmetsp:Transcript_14688/g.2417  ORF Transcript_14688/g.2417 Transcript_14688/m.2417 type:complete len:92 (-) Transcript_14688:218-493(-)